MGRTSHLSKLALTLIASGVMVLTAHQAKAQSNPSFEADLKGYTPLDKLSNAGDPPPPPPSAEVVSQLAEAEQEASRLAPYQTNSLALSPTHGGFFALLHTIRETSIGVYRCRQCVIVQDSFAIPPDATRLAVDLAFLTDEKDTGRTTNDTATIFLTVEATDQLRQEMVVVGFINRNQLQPDGEGRLTPLAVEGLGGFKMGTRFRTANVELPARFQGRSAFLTFYVRKAAPSLNERSRNTALAIDNIRLY